MTALHRFAAFVAASTLVLIAAGGMVTSTGSGLAVPDWPSTYGYFMFSFPLSKMVGGIFYEHGHRLIASVVGLLTIALAAWLWWRDDRRWMRGLGLVALAAVLLQGLLGGLTVLFFLPAPVSIGHAALAEIFFCLTVAIALFTSAGWRHTPAVADDPRLRRLAVATAGLVYVQILIGATVRHTGAGLAIPDFPLAFGGLLPPLWTTAIAVHFAHRFGALVVSLAVVAVAACAWRRQRRRPEIVRPAGLLLALVAAQITLGAWTVWSGRAVWINTAHLVTGALLLATSVVLALRACRPLFGDRPATSVAQTYRAAGNRLPDAVDRAPA